MPTELAKPGRQKSASLQRKAAYDNVYREINGIDGIFEPTSRLYRNVLASSMERVAHNLKNHTPQETTNYSRSTH